MNTCRHFEKHLSAFAQEELSAKHAAQVAAHLVHCAHCRAAVESYRALAREMRRLPETPVPEHVMHGFSREIMEQISSPRSVKITRRYDWFFALFTPRRRFAIASLATAGIVFALAFWQTAIERNGAPAHHLAHILQTRAWEKLYYGLLQKESRSLLLHEPVPVELVKTALTELLEQGERDQRLRRGLQKIFITIAGRELQPQEFEGAAKIMGVITTRGYRSAFRKRSAGYDARTMLRTVEKLPHGSQISLADLVKPLE